MVKREGLGALAGIAALIAVIGYLVLTAEYESPSRVIIRLTALYGLLFLSISSIMTPFLKEVTRAFGRPFIRVHHVFMGVGLTLATLHPVVLAVVTGNAGVFIPIFSSWYGFWAGAGRIALIIAYIAALAALLRGRFGAWRYVHALVYLVLTFVIVHAALLGSDFETPAIMAIYYVLYALVVAAFFLKRLQRRKMKGNTADTGRGATARSTRGGVSVNRDLTIVVKLNPA